MVTGTVVADLRRHCVEEVQDGERREEDSPQGELGKGGKLEFGAGDGYRLRLERWLAPVAIARAPAVANQVGPFRVALLVDDVHAFHADLRRRGTRFPSAPVWLDMGPEIPIDGLWALFFPDPDGACVELIQTPEPRG